MKKIIGFILLLTISFNSFSQANEEDINALSIFSEYVKAKNYDAALQPWMELRQRSPKFNSAIYVYGEKKEKTSRAKPLLATFLLNQHNYNMITKTSWGLAVLKFMQILIGLTMRT